MLLALKALMLKLKKPGRFFFLVLAISGLNNLHGQRVSLKIIPRNEQTVVKKLNYKKNHASRQEARQEIAAVLNHLQERGYLLAQTDTIIADSTRITAIVNAGDLYTIAYLRMGNLNPNIASRLGISEKLYFKKPFKYGEVARSIDKILVHYENNGYPFASVKLDSVLINGEKLSASLHVEPNKLYKIDSVKVTGTARINKKFLYRYLDISEGTAHGCFSCLYFRVRRFYGAERL